MFILGQDMAAIIDRSPSQKDYKYILIQLSMNSQEGKIESYDMYILYVWIFDIA